VRRRDADVVRPLGTLYLGFRPEHEVEEVVLRRRGFLVGDLPAVDTGHVRLRRERGDERREPAVVGRVGVLAREDEHVALCMPCSEVAGVPVPELLGRDLVDPGADGVRALGAAVRRARVDHHNLDLVVQGLRANRVEATDEVGSTVSRLSGTADGLRRYRLARGHAPVDPEA
jgi:hypothetical protein